MKWSPFYSFFFNDTATTEIYTSIDTLSLHDALPISGLGRAARHQWLCRRVPDPARRSEEHTSELQSPIDISYAVFCLKKKKINESANIFSVNLSQVHDRLQQLPQVDEVQVLRKLPFFF